MVERQLEFGGRQSVTSKHAPRKKGLASLQDASTSPRQMEMPLKWTQNFDRPFPYLGTSTL